MLALSLLTALTVGAHVPHDTVEVIAAPVDLSASVPWYLVADPYGISLLLRSEVGGRDWVHIGGDAVQDDLLGGAVLDDGTLVLLAPERIWWLADEDWSADALPCDASAMVYDGDAVALGASDGLWSWSPVLGFDHELVGPAITMLGEGPVAVDEDGEVWSTAGGSWAAVPAPAEPGAVLDTGEVYLADLDGQVWFLDGWEWSACGALPEPEQDLSPEIRRLAWDGERLLVAPGWRGPFASTDGCESWDDRSVPGIIGEDGFGQARTASAIWRSFAAAGERWVIGGYYGVFLSEDAGGSWEEQPILSPASTRGLAFSPSYLTDRGVYWGTYGAGVAITRDDGDSFVAPSHGFAEANIQSIRASVSGREHVMTALANHMAYVSRDTGRSWVRLEALSGPLSGFFPWDGGREYWAIPRDEETMLLESLDGGETFSEPEGLLAVLNGAQPASAARCQGSCDGRWRCLTAVNPTSLVCSTDRGETWELWYRAPGEPGDTSVARDAVTEPVLMPRDEPEVVIFGDPSGLHRVADRGASFTDSEVPGGEVPVELGCAAGDHVFVATRGGALLRSDDRGESWIDLGLRMSSAPTVMVSSPGFAEEPHLLIGHLDGIQSLLDPAGTPRLEPWTAWQRVDDGSGFFDKEDCPDAVREPGADLDGRQPLPDGARMTVDLVGETLRVLGTSGEGGSAQLHIDGVPRWRLDVGETLDGEVLALVEGLEPGWHRIELLGEGDGSLLIDAVEATGPEGFPVAETPESRCGCGASRVGLIGALLGMLLGSLRRRRPKGVS